MQKKNVQNWHDNINSIELSIDCDTFNADLFDNNNNEELYNNVTMSESTFLTDNILYYIAGFVVKTIIRTITCKGCIANIIKKIGDKQYNSSFTMLIDVRNRGGLVYVSNDVHKIVCATETEFRRSFITKEKKVPDKNAYSKISYRVSRRYALDTDVFSITDECYDKFDIGIEVPHRLQLINIICRKYLTLRMYSYSKTLTKDIVNPVSKRQKLSKLILFNNT